MSEPYTPTDEEMRAFCTAERLDGPHLSGFPTPTVGEAEAEFDRWLAEHDRQVAERAWGEGQKAGLLRADFEYGAIGYQHVKGNPYAKGVEHG